MNDTIEEIALADVFLDRETQIRAAASEETIQRYYDSMVDIAARDKFPPILLFRDKNGRLWLADGHHRVMAAIRRKFATILAIIRPGTKADAIWEAAKVNSKNGLQLGRADVRRTVEMILTECSEQSNRAIAETVRCSEAYVRKVADELRTSAQLNLPERTIGKDGKSRPAHRQKRGKSERKVDQHVASPEKPPALAQKSPVLRPETQVEEQPKPAADGHADARIAKEDKIFETIAILQQDVNEWFDLAPAELHKAFEMKLRERIQSLLGE